MSKRRILTSGALLVILGVASTSCASDSSEEAAVELLQDGIKAARDGDVESAERLLEESAAKRDGFVDPLMFLANLHERQDDLPAARSAYERALQADPMFTAAGVAYALTFVREEDSKAITVTKTTAEARSTVYAVDYEANGDEIRATTHSDDTVSTSTTGIDGASTVEFPDGTTTTAERCLTICGGAFAGDAGRNEGG